MRKGTFKQGIQDFTEKIDGGKIETQDNLLVDDTEKAAANRKRIKRGIVHLGKWKLLE